jgi:hypothetical protein
MAEKKLKKYILDAPAAAQVNLAQLDLAGTGALAADTLRSWLVQCGAGLNEDEVAAVMSEEDPQGSGVVLYHHFLQRYGPPQNDLARIAQERLRHGVYVRLRDRQQGTGQVDARRHTHAAPQREQEAPQPGSSLSHGKHTSSQESARNAHRPRAPLQESQQPPADHPQRSPTVSSAAPQPAAGRHAWHNEAYMPQRSSSTHSDLQQRLARETSDLGQLLRSGRSMGALEPYYQETVEQLRQLLTR